MHKLSDLQFHNLIKAKPENVQRLAKFLGIELTQKEDFNTDIDKCESSDHEKLCKAIIRYYKKNSQPKFSKR